MGTIISSGVGSGLDVAGLVTQLVQAEGLATQTRLDVEEARVQGKISALGTLRSSLSAFQGVVDELKDLDAFRGRQVTLSNPEFLGVAASATAEPGTHSIEVEQLASAHRLYGEFASDSTIVGTGTLTLSLGGSAFSVTIDSSNNTVAGIASAINAASDNTGVAATVVNGVSGARLVLSGNATGVSNAIVVTQSEGDDGLEALVYDPANATTNLTELAAAANSRVLVDGFAAESATNTIDASIAGLTIDLLATNEVGETTTVTVGLDRAAAKETVNRLVDSYNTLRETVDHLASIDLASGERGPLFGDAGLRNVVFQLRRELNSPVEGLEGSFSMLQQLGIETTLEGALTLDAGQLDAALDSDFDAVGQIFATPDIGLAYRLDALLTPYLESEGVLDGRNSSLQSTVASIAERREALAVRLAAVEERLLRQFNALDGLLAQLQSTSSFLNQQLASLPGFTFNNNRNT
jgi:flagellar hook-associated protein 2